MAVKKTFCDSISHALGCNLAMKFDNITGPVWRGESWQCHSPWDRPNPYVNDTPGTSIVPPCNCHRCHCHRATVQSTDEGIEIILALPGYTEEEVEAEWKDGHLTIALIPKDDDQLPWKKGLKKKTFSLLIDGNRVDTQRLKGKLANGVLVIKAPYLKHQKPVTVEIE